MSTDHSHQFLNDIKVARNLVFPRPTNLDCKLIDFSNFINFQLVLGVFNRSLSVKLGIFPVSCQHWHPKIFIIMLVKISPGKSPDVVVGVLKINLD